MHNYEWYDTRFRKDNHKLATGTLITQRSRVAESASVYAHLTNAGL